MIVCPTGINPTRNFCKIYIFTARR